MATRDHTVPRMYLRRFAVKRGKGHDVMATPVPVSGKTFRSEVKGVAAVDGFYWGTGPDGVDFHDVEVLLSKLESAAAQPFNILLDDHRYALIQGWPMRRDRRLTLAWWMAAQLLRTTRQRHRLEHLAEAKQLPSPPSLGKYDKNNPHLAFLVHQIGALAFILYDKPWGLGFSDTCLLTSDVPVVIFNDHDADDQLTSAWYWDIVLPLDPHRFIFLLGPSSQDDPRTQRDHRLKLPGGLGMIVNDIVYSAADRYIFWHPDHDVIAGLIRSRIHESPRLPRPWAGETHEAPNFMVRYGALHPDFTVERRWLTEHPPPRSSEKVDVDEPGHSPTEIVADLAERLEERKSRLVPPGGHP